jgi:hypothetical protein
LEFDLVQPFRDGFPSAALLGRLGETLPGGECDTFVRRRFPGSEDDGGTTLRSGETAGIFAPDPTSPEFRMVRMAGGSSLVGIPCATDGLPAHVVRAASPHIGVMSETRERHADRLSASEFGPFDLAQSKLEECPPRPGVTTLNDFMRLVAQTRQPLADASRSNSDDPACYGGGVSGTGDVEGPAISTDNALARYDGTSGKLIQNSGVTLLDDNHLVGPAAVTMPERAAPLPIASGQGQFWVSDNGGDPPTPRFSDDAGVDHELMVGDNNLSEITIAADARANLGLVIGTNVQAFDADLSAIAALGGTGIAVRTAANTWAQRSIAGSGRTVVADGGGVAGNPTITIDLTGANKVVLTTEVTGTLPIANGGTNATTAAAAATNLGVGTGDSPQFAAINVGHASDTTITRVSAGNLAVEGNALYRAGGTDVAIADGGTGQSTAAAAFSALKQAASDTDTGVIEIAIQSEMETASSTTLAVTPGRQHFHPGHPKCWAKVTVSGGTPTLQTSYNITSITDTAVGRLTVTIATDFSGTDWCCDVSVERPVTGTSGSDYRMATIRSGTQAAGSIELECHASASLADPAAWHMTGLGDL